MNTLLLAELKSDKKDLLQTLVLLEEHIFQEVACQPIKQGVAQTDQSLDSLETIIEQCQAVIEEIESPLEQAEILLNELYYQHLFIDKHKSVWPIDSFKVATSLNQRLMSPMVKAVLVCEIINACGFVTDLVFVPTKVMVRLCCDEQHAIIFDAVTGESLDWHELDLRLDDLDGDPSQHEIASMNRQAILVEHLSVLKNALIRELSFDKALLCVDLLLSLNPDDPLQRRDRGFLLHQLDCFKVAVDDYRYFVEQCPKDPAAQLLKIQLDNIILTEPTFH
ncbi:MAG: tetratricopeptide repeat protein [Colwellia sp.]|jgi:regulator of sirC expression with transglutaminase-like and TPR domain|nr:tetratricopeptide repeat protein [Colwellia sp.]